MALTAFVDELLPVCLWNVVSGSGSGWQTTISETAAGFETRNADYAEARAVFTFSGVGLSRTQMQALEDFHFQRRGRAQGFLYQDAVRPTVTGGEVRALAAAGTYQLRRPVGQVGRLVQKFNVPTLVVYTLNGQTEIQQTYTLNQSNGVVTITSDLEGRTPLWRGGWYYAVRFDGDAFAYTTPGPRNAFATDFTFREIRLR